MADADRKNIVVDGVLWDTAGQPWTTKHSRWATAKQASGFVGRDAPVGLIETPGRPLVWMSGRESQEWWAHAKRHFDVPGTIDAEPDADNLTWSAHVWERSGAQMLIFETNR